MSTDKLAKRPRFKHIRERYSDARTTQGRQLKAIMDDMAADLGGWDNLNAGQRLLMNLIKSKLIVILTISAWADKRQSLINRKGELTPSLDRNYLAYANSLRLSIAQLYKHHKGKRAATLDEYLASRKTQQ